MRAFNYTVQIITVSLVFTAGCVAGHYHGKAETLEAYVVSFTHTAKEIYNAK